ncbi:putative mitochondrial hypothetical protein [Leptomonas pyrrhocoris]|uniref:Uncharacterized protein n=1 Tax=Leptomonas pyrrhocoris TaxID=157538 RepID=A0A0M9G8J8_LEPPY|nr:putative mitochondrial hypothetical protein [Leptomonas pyrrhocoris]KPA85000.1 putative mitochondrial hypothetical protein [Leptomonas pyrrhocoris]|eukprot:XP_015663439.1 putative mitochondrial hypothetical protein [Leptomonas pyrrhocoris]
MHRRWGNMKDLSRQEKEELLNGAWREAKPIQLVADEADRDGGGFTAPVTFHTEEAAQKFLAEEDADDAAELRESTLALAQRFFVELAAAADEELDAGQMPPPPQSDDERRREMRDVQRHFFADFYVEQGLISEAERYAFVDTMLRPSRAFFLVNSTLPLVRLTVRDQLECHHSAGAMSDTPSPVTSARSADVTATAAAASPSPNTSPVFAATDLDACLYVVPLVPTQSIGAPLYEPFTAATTRVSLAESGSNPAAGLLDGKAREDARTVSSSTTAVAETEAIDSADMLGAMLQDDFSMQDNEGRESVKEEAKGHEASTNAPDQDSVVASYRPPTLAHTYWLQRQVASGSLLNVDLLSHAISVLSVHLAAAVAPRDASAEVESSYAVLLYQADTTADVRLGRAASSTYHTEIAQYLFRATQEEEQDDDAVSRLRSVVVVVEDATFTPVKSSASRRFKAQGHAELFAALPIHDASAVPVADRYPNLVYVIPPKQAHRHRHLHKSSSSTASQKRVKLHTPPRGRVVVCVPTTSQDGVRPRGWLSSGEPDEAADGLSNSSGGSEAAPDVGTAGGSPARIFSTAPPNSFVERCQLANTNFSRLQQCLYNAIHAVDVGSGRGDAPTDGGWVIYATQSVNVIENEAVVCAVLQQIDAEGRQLEANSCPLEAGEPAPPPLQVECVPFISADAERYVPHRDSAAETVRLLRREGREGFPTWVAIEDGSSAQEAEQYPLALRTAVAHASWRTDPVRKGDDGGYLICLRVTARGAASIVVEDTPLLRGTDKAAPTSPLCWWTHPQSRVTCAVTPAMLRFLEAASRPPAAGLNGQKSLRYRSGVLHAGVPVGLLPSSSHPESTAVKDAVATCQCSSATAHAEVLAALKKALPVLRLSSLAFSELLLAKEVRSRRVRRQLHLRDKQLAQVQQSPNSNGSIRAEKGAVTRESLAFLAAVEELICQNEDGLNHDNNRATGTPGALSQTRFNVVVEAASDSFIPAVSPNGAELTISALHPAVAEELHSAGIVAQVEYAKRPNVKASAMVMEHDSSPDNSSFYDFTLRLDVPLDIPERAKHLAAMEEWRVALRDALLYVCRRTGAAPSAISRLWDDKAVCPDETESEVRLPPGDEADVELAEDDYEAAADMRQRFQRHSGQAIAPAVDLLAQESIALAYERSGGNDWLEDTNYREWRRRHASR